MTCGTGHALRERTVQTAASCGGIPCSQLIEKKSCTGQADRDCKVFTSITEIIAIDLINVTYLLDRSVPGRRGVIAYQTADIAEPALRLVPALSMKVVCVAELPVRHCLVLAVVLAAALLTVSLPIGDSGAVARQRADRVFSKLRLYPVLFLIKLTCFTARTPCVRPHAGSYTKSGRRVVAHVSPNVIKQVCTRTGPKRV